MRPIILASVLLLSTAASAFPQFTMDDLPPGADSACFVVSKAGCFPGTLTVTTAPCPIVGTGRIDDDHSSVGFGLIVLFLTMIMVVLQVLVAPFAKASRNAAATVPPSPEGPYRSPPPDLDRVRRLERRVAGLRSAFRAGMLSRIGFLMTIVSLINMIVNAVRFMLATRTAEECFLTMCYVHAAMSLIGAALMTEVPKRIIRAVRTTWSSLDD